jgi:translation initiation factor 3 subunit F
MASNITVKVHPVVYMTMVDSYERRSQKSGVNNRALGTLLGFYEKNAVQVTNCYSIPFRETPEGAPEINDLFNMQMWQVNKRATPSETVVGWFFTVAEPTETCMMYHSYYTKMITELSVKKELPPIVLLTMDVNFKSVAVVDGQAREVPNFRLPVRAYQKIDAGVPGQMFQAQIFQPLKVEMDAFIGERVALSLVTKGIDDKGRQVILETGLEQLEGSTEKMIEWLERLLDYVNDVLKQPELPADSSMGRRLMDIVTTASTQLQPEKLDNLIKNSLRDYMMVSYLANLTKTQLTLQEKMIVT